MDKRAVKEVFKDYLMFIEFIFIIVMFVVVLFVLTMFFDAVGFVIGMLLFLFGLPFVIFYSIEREV